MPIKSFTLRIEEDLYQKTRNIAKKENCSVNSLIEKLILEKLQEKEKKELFDEFSLVGQDKQISNVEFYLNAQKEVLFNEKS
mgnify:CR=1 FL=1